MAGSVDISVVIPTFNQATTLRRTLRGFLAQIGPQLRTQLVVVDDGSADATEQVVAQLMGASSVPITYVRQENKGAAAARNAGLAHAWGEVVLFCDGDVIPAPGMVDAHAGFHRSHPCLTHVALGRVEMAVELAHAQQIRQFETTLPFEDESCVEVPWHYVRGSNFSAKREFLLLAGGFDVRMRSAAEDTELAFRLQQRGARVFFLPLAVGIHYHPMTEEASYLAKAQAYGESLAYWYRKAPEARGFVTSRYGLQTPYSGWCATVRHFLHGLLFNRGTEAAWMRLASYAADSCGGVAAWVRNQVYRACYRRSFRMHVHAPLPRGEDNPARSWTAAVRVVSSPTVRCLCHVRS